MENGSGVPSECPQQEPAATETVALTSPSSVTSSVLLGALYPVCKDKHHVTLPVNAICTQAAGSVTVEVPSP